MPFAIAELVETPRRQMRELCSVAAACIDSDTVLAKAVRITSTNASLIGRWDDSDLQLSSHTGTLHTRAAEEEIVLSGGSTRC